MGHDRDEDGVDDHDNGRGAGHDLTRRATDATPGSGAGSTKPGKADRQDGVIFVPPLVGLLAAAAAGRRRTTRRVRGTQHD